MAILTSVRSVGFSKIPSYEKPYAVTGGIMVSIGHLADRLIEKPKDIFESLKKAWDRVIGTW